MNKETEKFTKEDRSKLDYTLYNEYFRTLLTYLQSIIDNYLRLQISSSNSMLTYEYEVVRANIQKLMNSMDLINNRTKFDAYTSPAVVIYASHRGRGEIVVPPLSASFAT